MENIKYDIFNTKDKATNETLFLLVDQQLLENERFAKRKQEERDSHINTALIEIYEKEQIDKIYIYLPYENREEAKIKGVYWDPKVKLWYVSDINNILYEKYKQRFLKNKYERKDFYKDNGGKWDKLRSHWFTYNSNEKLKPFFVEN